MSRLPRNIKAQKEFIINYLDSNKILLGGKINLCELPKIIKLWERLTNEVNKIGPPKTVKQWKDVSI